ncbi:alpha/beta fold hydrolase [Limibacillus halophilus]
MSARPPSLPLLALLLLLALTSACTARHAPPGPYAGGGGPGTSLAEERFLTWDGLSLPLRAWLPEEEPWAVILALHGMNDYSQAFALPGAALAQAGVATYAYDQRGFGEAPARGLWAGKESYARDLRDAARLVAARHPGTPLYLLGDSFGGAVTVAALSRGWPAEVSGAILVAPAVRDREALGPIASASLWIAAGLFPGWKPTGADLKIQATDNIPELRAFSNDPLVIKGTRMDTVEGLVDIMDAAQREAGGLDGPLLLLYGAKDEVIPQEAMERFWRSLSAGNPQARRIDYEKGWHWLLRDLQREAVYGDLLLWLADPTSPVLHGETRLPSQPGS